MNFSLLEICAVVKASSTMILANGNVEQSEVEALYNELKNFGLENISDDILEYADAMDPSDMVEILSNMSDEKKKYVAGFWAVIMIADDEIDDEEVKSWQILCSKSQFPVMNLREAINYWHEH